MQTRLLTLFGSGIVLSFDYLISFICRSQVFCTLAENNFRQLPHFCFTRINAGYWIFFYAFWQQSGLFAWQWCYVVYSRLSVLRAVFMVNRVNCIKANIAENFLQTSLQQYATLLNSLILYTDQHGHNHVGNVYFGVFLDPIENNRHC